MTINLVGEEIIVIDFISFILKSNNYIKTFSLIRGCFLQGENTKGHISIWKINRNNNKERCVMSKNHSDIN